MGELIAFIIGGLIVAFFPSGGGDFLNTQKRKKNNDEMEQRIREKFKNGSGSSKEELQNWWDKYH